MLDLTGTFVPSCPWRAFRHPLVGEVMRAVQFYETGNLAFAHPEPSHRLVEGIRHWNSAYNRMHSRQLEIERETLERERVREQARAPAVRRRRR